MRSAFDFKSCRVGWKGSASVGAAPTLSDYSARVGNVPWKQSRGESAVLKVPSQLELDLASFNGKLLLLQWWVSRGSSPMSFRINTGMPWANHVACDLRLMTMHSGTTHSLELILERALSYSFQESLDVDDCIISLGAALLQAWCIAHRVAL
jgi:hypothetical protein